METGQYACMSKDTDEFRKLAEDCRKFAALKLNDRAFWLELADETRPRGRSREAPLAGYFRQSTNARAQ